MQGEITFHLNSGKDESWIITETEFERLQAEIFVGHPRVLRLTTVDEGREVLICQQRVEAVEFSLIDAGIIHPAAGQAVPLAWEDLRRISIMDLLAPADPDQDLGEAADSVTSRDGVKNDGDWSWE